MTTTDITVVRNLVGYERFLEDLVRLLEEGRVPDTFMHANIDVSRKMMKVVDMVCTLMGIDDGDEEAELDEE